MNRLDDVVNLDVGPAHFAVPPFEADPSASMHALGATLSVTMAVPGRAPLEWRHHEEAVRFGADCYLRQLQALLSSSELSDVGHAGVTSLVESIQAALRLGARLQPSDVSFSAHSLAGTRAQDRAAVINQWSLGLGNPQATVVVMGTEQGFDPFDDGYLANLALENCASQLLWLGDDRGELTRAIAGDSWNRSQGISGYLRQPVAYYNHPPTGHTWRMIARVLGIPFERLADVAYQVDRSATAALTSVRGVPPTAERADFLVDLLRVLSRTASHLILHGRMNDPAWEAVNRRLAAAFVGAPADFEWEIRPAGAMSAKVFPHSGRRVIGLPALNGGVRGIWDAIEPMRALVGYL